MKKFLIFNADDFGASTGVNRGIIHAHTHGVVTSTSLMVTGHAVQEAVALSRQHPSLAVGLHWDVWGEDERAFDADDAEAVRDELRVQLRRFQDLVGRDPTHLDSHKHAHRSPNAMPVFCEVGAELGIPVRGDGQVAYLRGFYAQWEWKVTDLRHVSSDFLQHLVRTEVLAGFSEIGCHPGYVSPYYHAVYLSEREAELDTLTTNAIRATLAEENIELISFADVLRHDGAAARGAER